MKILIFLPGGILGNDTSIIHFDMLQIITLLLHERFGRIDLRLDFELGPFLLFSASLCNGFWNLSNQIFPENVRRNESHLFIFRVPGDFCVALKMLPSLLMNTFLLCPLCKQILINRISVEYLMKWAPF